MKRNFIELLHRKAKLQHLKLTLTLASQDNELPIVLNKVNVNRIRIPIRIVRLRAGLSAFNSR